MRGSGFESLLRHHSLQALSLNAAEGAARNRSGSAERPVASQGSRIRIPRQSAALGAGRFGFHDSPQPLGRGPTFGGRARGDTNRPFRLGRVVLGDGRAAIPGAGPAQQRTSPPYSRSSRLAGGSNEGDGVRTSHPPAPSRLAMIHRAEVAKVSSARMRRRRVERVSLDPHRDPEPAPRPPAITALLRLAVRGRRSRPLRRKVPPHQGVGPVPVGKPLDRAPSDSSVEPLGGAGVEPQVATPRDAACASTAATSKAAYPRRRTRGPRRRRRARGSGRAADRGRARPGSPCRRARRRRGARRCAASGRGRRRPRIRPPSPRRGCVPGPARRPPSASAR